MINLFSKSYTEKEINFFRFLSRMKLFEKLTYKEMSLLHPFFYLREYKMDEVVFFRNDPSNALYLVKSGKVSLCLDMKEGFENLLIIKAGTVFGENAFLKQAIRQFNAIVTSEKSELYVIPKVNLDDTLEGHSKIKSKMLESLAEIYNDFQMNLFKGYKSSHGLFDLSQVFGN